jgi:quercetin dioxygenase-like cupin family protein
VPPLCKLLQYQDGSVVSRVLLKNKGGTVTLFAFDQGEGLSEQTAPFEALIFVIDGEAEVEIAGRAYSVRTGETITLPANIPRSEGGDQIQDAADHNTSIDQNNESSR